MIVLFVFVFSLFATDSLDQLITELGSVDEKASVAISKLKASGKASLPFLIARMSDKNVSNPIVGYTESMIPLHDGKVTREVHAMTIGRVCFLVAREQLEAGEAGVKSDIHFITPDNIQSWFEANKEITLNQMRINVLKKTLQLICNSAAQDGLQDRHIHQMNIVINRLNTLQELESQRTLKTLINDLEPNSPTGKMLHPLLDSVK